jgi:hypothetical protein
MVLQAALRYGVAMLKRTGGGLRSHVQVDNAYERRLLAGAELNMPERPMHPSAAAGLQSALCAPSPLY